MAARAFPDGAHGGPACIAASGSARGPAWRFLPCLARAARQFLLVAEVAASIETQPRPGPESDASARRLIGLQNMP
jgi:hypothetical protein